MNPVATTAVRGGKGPGEDDPRARKPARLRPAEGPSAGKVLGGFRERLRPPARASPPPRRGGQGGSEDVAPTRIAARPGARGYRRPRAGGGGAARGARRGGGDGAAGAGGRVGARSDRLRHGCGPDLGSD